MHAMEVAPVSAGHALRPGPEEIHLVHDDVEKADEALIACIASGDRAAFATLFGKYAPKVKTYLMRLGASNASAEDLTQDALLSVWRRSGTFDPSRAKARTWIFVIARNAWIDRLRRERVELAYVTAPGDEPEVEEAPEEAVARRQTEARIGSVLRTLPEEQRQVVLLSFFEDRAHADIAEHLSLPLGTVKSRLRLALGKLRSQWEDLR
jgi:RNA polymerase sigma-70 factor, ECF subfamily